MGISSMKFLLGLKKFILEFLNFKTFMQMVKYVVTGGVSFISYISLLYILTEWLDIWKYISLTISYITVFWLNFLLTKYWTFEAKQSNGTKRQLILYTCLSLVNLLLTYLIVHILTDIFGVYYIISTVICNIMIVGWNFILYRKVIYK